jgi:multiple sugar transport system substrate-binding protein
MKNFAILFCSTLLLFFGCSKDNPNTKVLKVAHIYDPMASISAKENYKWFEKIAEKFTKDNPNVKIEFEILKWDEIDVKSMSDLRTNISHDIIMSSPQLMAQHGLVGDLLDLSPFIKKYSNEFDEMRWSPVWNTGSIDNKYFGFPMGVHSRFVVYKKDFFKDAGLDPDRPPKDLDELVQYAQKLTRDIDGDGKTDIWGLGMNLGNNRGTAELYFAPLIWHFDGDIWDPNTKKASFATEAGIKSAQFLYDLIYKYKVTPEWVLAGTLDDVVLRPFLDGKIAMAWGWGTYWIYALEEKGWFKGIFPPKENGTAEIADAFVTPTKEGKQFENSWSISIHKLSKNPELSFEFLRYLLKPEDLSVFPDAGLPVHNSIWNKKEYKTPFYKTMLQSIEKGRAMPSTAHYTELVLTISTALQEIMVKKSDIKTTLKKFEDEYNSKYAGE